ncbi:hypothetical protein ACWFMI_24955 [Nocardiopsis terrae]|uniref:hypothetical protein n=1 Tax=Streptomyces sp. NPDC057554 TaxID=3350538 RepID=UPI0036754E63
MSDLLPGMPAPLEGMPGTTPRPRPTLADFPHRIRVYGGRNPHAARTEPPGRGYRQWTHRTACDRVSDAGTTSRMADHLLPDDTPVGCTACARALDIPKEPRP